MLELRARSKRSGLTSWLAREELRGSLCLPSLTAPLPHSLPRSRPGAVSPSPPCLGGGARAVPALRGAGQSRGGGPAPLAGTAAGAAPVSPVPTGAKARGVVRAQLYRVLRLWDT